MPENRSAKAAAVNVDELKQRATVHVMEAVAERWSLLNRLGLTHSGKRDLYEACGYKTTLEFDDYDHRYRRGDVAKAIIDRPVDRSWGSQPKIEERKGKTTKLEAAWSVLAKESALFDKMARVDRLACLGTYAILVLGFDDAGAMDTEVTAATSLLYCNAYSQKTARIYSIFEDTKDPRYGKPEFYDVNVKIGTEKIHKARPIRVHQSRVIHVVSDSLESDVEGIPRLEAPFNRLQDLETIAAGGTEMFWRGAFMGLGFVLNDGVEMPVDEELSKFNHEIEEYVHGLKRYMRLQGMKVENLAPQVSDPRGHAEVCKDLIAAASGIPKRILFGSEAGQLASGQDDSNWSTIIRQRQRVICEAKILRPTVDRLIAVGVLPAPETDEYRVVWADLEDRRPSEIADTASRIADALSKYNNSAGIDEMLPPEIFLTDVLGFDKDRVEEIMELATKIANQNRLEAESDATIAAAVGGTTPGEAGGPV